MMNKSWIAALCLGALMTACKDENVSAPDQSQLKQTTEMPQLLPEEPAVPQGEPSALPVEADVRSQLLPALASFPAVRLGEIRMDTTQDENGEVLITARVQTIVGENIYTQEPAPEMLNEERKAANDSVNAAMLPESHYLLQVGATTDVLTDENRRAKALPEELQKLADEMKQMAESPVYHLHTAAGTVVEIPVSMKARKEGREWVFSEINFGTEALRSLVGTLPEGALPQGALIVNEGFEMQRRQALREKIAAFDEAAKPYIQTREDAARRRLLEIRSSKEIEERAAAEQATEQAACREIWEKACAEILKAGAVFSGEWKRGDAFGKLAIRMARVQSFPDSLQFVGVLYNPDMPQAEIQIVGRFESPASSQEQVSAIVHLYNGRYDPDIPTAEVFDAKDGVLRLKLAPDGSVSGELTCEAWADAPEKAFSVTLTYTPKVVRRRSSR